MPRQESPSIPQDCACELVCVFALCSMIFANFIDFEGQDCELILCACVDNPNPLHFELFSFIFVKCVLFLALSV